ncbi:MAG TPA: hypothetical protein VGG72_14845 [Bryobacteraceae bacterium]
MFVSGLLAQQGPRRWSFTEAAVIKIDNSGPYYQYTLETTLERYVVESPTRLAVTEGLHVKVAIAGGYVYITDEDGKPQQTIGVTQYRIPKPPEPKKNASWFDPNREPTLPLNLHG